MRARRAPGEIQGEIGMDGLNEKFMEDPPGFLRKYLLSVNPLDMMELKSDHYQLDLVPAGVDAKLVSTVRKPKVPKVGEDPSILLAWWLLWNKGQTTDVMLGSGPDYFFTSKMDGCQLRVIDCEGGPKVMHIDGGAMIQGEGSSKERGADWRADQGMQGGAEGARFRALSSTDVHGNQSYGNATVHVVGFRKKGAWEFWVQESKAKVYQFHTAV
jgi:hypothetical protein